jgi:hypothetical protein
MSWSASIYPSGAWFCEIAGSMSMLFEEECKEKGWKGWPVEPGWWWRIPADFGEQMEMFCSRCGFPAPFRRRASNEGVDDISPKNFDRIKDFSKKVARGKYEIYDFTNKDLKMAEAPMGAYKDTPYRNAIAGRYGMFLSINEQRFWTPHLIKNWDRDKGGECLPKKDLLSMMQEQHRPL